jgi:RNA polymerase-binding transcription factor DksA
MAAKERYWNDPERYRAEQKAYRDAMPMDKKRELKRKAYKNRSSAAIEHQREYRREWEKENRIRKEAYRIRSKFNIQTIDEAEALVRRREFGVCDSCGSNPHRRLKHIDHCHVTGKVRGVLCNKCNVSLGLVNDNIDHLEQIIAYLRRHQ